ncbi:hypothetical protein [Leuconostoc citreum]|uniref:hypothetical protein n=1 Tax=Leuconostoc citreum TaxID=33964 RepID=UPI002A7F79F9|nr:hypothetical protein [Leuconostoc citreum]MDY5162904.1 hypothetical protein [Leuconostoc citreum]MDY5166506.1 hypothetical protein [Leuconostoc citreum]
MTNFNDIEYTLIISELINDAFYSNLSNRGKISEIRQFSEILLRKILNIGSDRNIVIGKLTQPAFRKNATSNDGASEELKKLPENRQKELLDIIETFRSTSNEATHTNHIETFTDDDLNDVTDSLFSLYAFLFEEYFLKYPIDINTNPSVLFNFSLLPPIIRYKTLNYLFVSGYQNIYVSDKLVLAMLKTKGKKFAIDWIDKNKKDLLSQPYPNSQQKTIFFNEFLDKTISNNKDVINRISSEDEKKYVYNQLMNITEQELNDFLNSFPFKNNFELLLDKINKVSDYIDNHGVMYQTFEEAVEHYKKYVVEGESPEIMELKNIMDFVYMGRK